MRSLLLIVLLSFFSVSTTAQANCQYGDIKSLTEKWKSFRQASLHESPREIAKYYKFPLKLLSPYDDEKPILISKKAFLKDYGSIFQEIVQGHEIDLFKDLKKTTGNEYISERGFDQTGCRHPPLNAIRIEDYNFIWATKNGWLIESVYYGSDYDLLKSSLDN